MQTLLTAEQHIERGCALLAESAADGVAWAHAASLSSRARGHFAAARALLARDEATAAAALREVYRDRAHLVALLAALFPSVLAYNDPSEPEWPVCYVETQHGQLSWHIARTDLDLFDHVETVAPDHPSAQWDGHSTADKHGRMTTLAAEAARERTA